ncbi:hypothetical protein SKAU_G00110610 [Synaphobranchus kaupii]|uniref:Uncharacterized protein n=1 Tax=Synaphobranchus kaupii TaxID=118154 RepID=A0A9Q1G076_SYNKA|nr:hypothetical protein SKAU_G00110610 [Synaphobranchus kaupii]
MIKTALQRETDNKAFLDRNRLTVREERRGLGGLFVPVEAENGHPAPPPPPRAGLRHQDILLEDNMPHACIRTPGKKDWRKMTATVRICSPPLTLT